MPDLRDKQQAKLRARKQKHRSPGNNNALPNTEHLDREGLPGDVARDVSNEGVMDDPKRHERHLNP
jgi:hypothetical protein